MAAPKGNKYALGLTNSGRPLKFKTGAALQRRCNKYFEWIQGEREADIQEDIGDGKAVTVPGKWIRYSEPATITGLALFLGFCNKSSLYDYAKKSDEFSLPIKRALSMVEHGYELNINGKNAAGPIFALKNFGWKDEQHVNQTNVNLNSKELDDEALDKRINELKQG